MSFIGGFTAIIIIIIINVAILIMALSYHDYIAMHAYLPLLIVLFILLHNVIPWSSESYMGMNYVNLI